MRVIGGRIGGIRLHPPTNLPVRPTTDLAKEALFNILEYQIDWSESDCLDLFCGTGSISIELASRFARSVDAIDIHVKCIHFLKDTAKKHALNTIHTQKADVFKFITSTNKKFDFIFADPPFDHPKLIQLPELIFQNNLLKEDGLLVVEHPSMRKMLNSDLLVETRKYGYSSFSFYKQKKS